MVWRRHKKPKFEDVRIYISWRNRAEDPDDDRNSPRRLSGKWLSRYSLFEGDESSRSEEAFDSKLAELLDRLTDRLTDRVGSEGHGSSGLWRSLWLLENSEESFGDAGNVWLEGKKTGEEIQLFQPDLDDESELDIQAAFSLGLNPANLAVSRVLPVNIYLADGENAPAVVDALRHFLSTFGFKPIGQMPPRHSSFLGKEWFRTKTKQTLDELSSKLKKVEEALETQQIDKPKSEIDLNHAEATAKLLDALGKECKSSAIQIGNLLTVTIVDDNGDRHYRVVTLTKEQVEMIQRDDSLLQRPELLLQHLDARKRRTGDQ